MTRAIWIDVMGGPEVIVDVTTDEDAKKVYVDAPTLIAMAKAIPASGIFSDEDANGFAHALLQSLFSAAPEGLIDVTEAGGGWGQWLNDLENADGSFGRAL